jgi:hypothetical protein
MGSLLRNYRINTADLLSNKFVEFLVESNPPLKLDEITK